MGRAGDRGGDEGEVTGVRVDGKFIKVRSQVAVGGGHGAKGAEAAPGAGGVRMLGVDVVQMYPVRLRVTVGQTAWVTTRE